MLVVTTCPELGGTMFRVVSLMIAAALLAQAPAVYHITHTYMLGGDGRWDYVVPDPPQHRVFIGRQNAAIIVRDGAKGRSPASLPSFV